LSIEAQLKEIKALLLEVNRKLDSLIEENEIEALMVLEEDALKDFLSEEPELYSK
jgi:hypothetical protein